MYLLNSIELKSGNHYHVYKDGEPCSFVIRLDKKGRVTTVDYSRIIGAGISNSCNYYKFSPNSMFEFAIISEYSFNRMFNYVINKLKNDE